MHQNVGEENTEQGMKSFTNLLSSFVSINTLFTQHKLKVIFDKCHT